MFNCLASRIKTGLLISAVLLLMACTPQVDVNAPLELLWDKNSDKNSTKNNSETKNLIVFLPGLYDVAETFKKEKFFTLARSAGVTADMVAASVHIDHLLQNKGMLRIEEDILKPALKAGYKHIWFVGVSLGGLNSLLFLKEHTQDICGVVLLAPYLGDKVIAAEIENAGGLKNWEPNHFLDPEEIEKKQRVDIRVQDLWHWIKQQDSKTLKKIHLGFGSKDRYAKAHQQLALFLDKQNVTEITGAHEWKTGRKLWQQQLNSRDKTGLLNTCH